MRDSIGTNEWNRGITALVGGGQHVESLCHCAVDVTHLGLCQLLIIRFGGLCKLRSHSPDFIVQCLNAKAKEPHHSCALWQKEY